MFTPWRVSEGVSLKRRCTRISVARVRRPDLGGLRLRVLALGPGCLSPGTFVRFFWWAKRVCRECGIQRRF